MKFTWLILLLPLLAGAGPMDYAHVGGRGLGPVAAASGLTSDGSSADVVAKIASASDGDTVTIPAGAFTWTNQVAISKGVILQGAGAGRVVARSESSVTVGTGSKSFTLIETGLGFTNGQTLRVDRTGNPVSSGNSTFTRTYMIGTVTSYSGTSLTLDVTTVGNNGATDKQWIVSTEAATTVTHNYAGILLSLTEDATHNLQVRGIRFLSGTGTDDFIRIAGAGKPVIIASNYFESEDNYDCIQTSRNQGLVHNCSFTAYPFAPTQLAIHAKDCPTDSWTTASTMGTNDVGQTNNFYVENCDFHAWNNAMDWDDSSRSVTRHSLFNHAGFGTHGADTSNYGVRHYEAYGNTFYYKEYSDGTTINVQWLFYLRGGTGVIYSNTMADIGAGGSDYGDKADINMTVMNLRRNAGPNGCWGMDNSGAQYPAPRQVGLGRVTGSAGNDSITYTGDSEPLYVWGNTGTYTASTSDYPTSEGDSCSGAYDATADYVQSARDYYNDGTAKPNWVASAYPHPLR